MKQKILRSLVLMIVIGIVVSSILYFNSYYQEDLKKERSYIVDATNNLESWFSYIDSQDSLENLFEKLNKSTQLNYFYLDRNGELLYGDEEVFNELYLDEDTISGILEGKTNLVLYNRDGSRNYLIESRINDFGDYLIVSKLANNPLDSFLDAIPGIMTLLALGFFIALFISERTVDDFIGTIEEQARDTNFDSIEITTKYKELYPFIRIIRDQNEDINRHVMRVEHQGETLEAIISNMKEGMILLDDAMNILAINDSAVKLGDIDYYGVNYRGVNLRGLFRSDELNENFDVIMREPNKSYSFDIPLNNKIINIIVSPVLNSSTNVGFVIFLVDETKQKLVEAQRREFSANVSHELKTPLTSINGYAEMMMNGFVKPDDMIRFSEIIYNEGLNLLNMIDDIIKISKLDEGDQSLDLDNINFSELVLEIVSTLEYKIENQKIDLSLNLLEKNYRFNKQVLKELLMNLIDNGIKYNNYGGKLTISQREIAPDTIEIKIKDTGIGISEIDQERVFERFYTVDKSHNKKDSSGLGLAIVKHITKLLGGTINLKSELGKGSEFTLNLPISDL